MKQKFFIETFGCKVNQYNGMVLRQNLISAGFSEANTLEQADILIVSSCVVTEKAEHEVLSLIRKWKKNHKKVYAVGCFGQQMTTILHQEAIVSGSEQDIFDLLVDGKTMSYHNLLFDAGQKSRAFVKIQTGCNQFCSYCIVPYTRGKPFSKTKDDILKEIEGLYQHGIREIVLTGTQIGLYQSENQSLPALSDLLKAIETHFSGKLYRARLSSIHPNFVDEQLLQVMGESHLWCNHLHLSLQSGSDKILSAMDRKYGASQYLDKIALARKLIPEILFTTDLIVGFPGESEEDFLQSCSLVKAVHFSKLHIFPYSVRKESSSYHMNSQVHPLEIQHRKRRLLELSKYLSYNLNCTFMGKKVEVLIERDYTGYTRNYKKVILLKDESRCPHSLLQVIISRCSEDVLFE